MEGERERERKADTDLFCLFGFFVLFRDYYFRFFLNRGNPRERKNGGGGIYLQHTHERARALDVISGQFLFFTFFSPSFLRPRERLLDLSLPRISALSFAISLDSLDVDL